MLTRGHIIGKLIDDLAILKGQIELRNKAGIFDLTKFSEDFFRELLNIIYGLGLKNLNESRSNEPGLDLGDIHNKIAFQITSEKTSSKINSTLDKITKEQKSIYNTFNVLIIGDKQNSYSLTQDLVDSVGFKEKENLLDLTNIAKVIVTLDLVDLHQIHDLFKRDLRNVTIELEPMDSDGNFESSIFNSIEVISNKPPENVELLEEHFEVSLDISDYEALYHNLASVPRKFREYICLIAERGKHKEYNKGGQLEYGILALKLSTYLEIKEEDLFQEMLVIEDENLLYLGEETDSYDRNVYSYVIDSSELNIIIEYLKEKNLSIRKLIMKLDFSILESQSA